MSAEEPRPNFSAVNAASQRVAAYLREAILTGEIAPGDRIRQEEIAERLGASRLPVREALHMLEAEGLTQLETNRGARVPALDRDEVEVIYRMRERLEPLALMESLRFLTDDQERELGRIQDSIEATEDIAEFLELDRRFHLLSYAGCRSAQLSNSVTRLWNSTQHYRRAFMQVSGSARRWVVNAEHRLLLEAIVRRDPVDCERYLAGHIRRTRIELIEHPEVFAPAGRGPRSRG
jgi:DNA-binding GntR family transcriptional regulator